jgi:hypothetical protein
MHMQYPVPPKVIPQVLPRSHHPLELPPIDHRTIGKSPLRPIHTHGPAAERSKMALRPAMNLIALRHTITPSELRANPRNVISTDPERSRMGVHRLIANSAVEKPALSEVERNPRISPLPLPVLKSVSSVKSTVGLQPFFSP